MPASRIYNSCGCIGGGGGGATAEEVVTLPFNFNDASPEVIVNIPANSRIISTMIQLTTPFDDSSATLSVGDDLNPSRLFDASEIEIDEEDEYISYNTFHYLANTDLKLTLNPAASTQGAGVVVIIYDGKPVSDLEAAEEIFTFPFNFDDASPETIFTIPANARIVSVIVQQLYAFDDPAATIEVGDAGNMARLMSASQNNPNEVGEYESHNPHQYILATDLKLSINPGASTTGSGVVAITYNTNV